MDSDVLAIAAVAITVVLFVLLSYLGRKKNVDFRILTILALVFGIVIGIIFKGHVELTAVFGRIYTNLISALVIPLLFVSIISSISSLDNISKLKTIGKGHVELTAVFGRIYTNLISALVIPLLFVSIISSISSLDNISKLKTIGLKSIFWLVANTFTASLLTLIIAGSLLFVSIISSISSLDNISKLKTIGLKSIFWLVANTFTASLLTLIIAGSLKVGQSINFTLPTDYEPKEVPSFLDTIVGLFPKNVVSHAANGEIVPFIVFTIMAGVALVYLQEREKEAAVPFKNFIDSANKLMFVVVEFVVDLTPFAVIMAGVALVYLQEREKEAAVPFKNFIDSANKLMFVVVEFVVDLTPFAVLSLIANAVSTYGAKELIPLLGVLVLAWVLCAIQMFLIDGALIRFVGGLSPIRFFRGFWPAQVVAFTSQSSVGTIPVSVKQLVSRLGVNEDIASFVAALGANLGMPACAGIWPTLLAVLAINIANLGMPACAGIWPTLLAVLAINIFDIPYSIGQYAFLIVLTLIVSIGTVGVPGTSTVTTTALFTAAGLPVEIIVLLVPISSVVDMMRTAANVTGAATAAVLVAKSEQLLDREVYDQGKSEEGLSGAVAVGESAR